MLFDPKELNVVLVDAPKKIRLVGVSYNGYSGGEMAQVTGTVLSGKVFFECVEVSSVTGRDSFCEQLDALSALPPDSRVTVNAQGIGSGVVEELTRRHTNTTTFRPRALSRTERFSSEFALIIHCVANHSRPELAVELMRLLEVSPMGNWRLVEATEEMAKLIAIACANFVREQEAKKDINGTL
ncbi:hypothetical protein [Vibrio campbellii]|uniref:hypothetical protein n=1 Tax=Vibrio campbellii TaxID=680 RepID=UPI00210D9CF1|nr:hypothetical protein [Vibrio campbellii]UTZ44562.1 hypothetical protein HB764_25210 [Vibrio campbellii]